MFLAEKSNYLVIRIIILLYYIKFNRNTHDISDYIFILLKSITHDYFEK